MDSAFEIISKGVENHIRMIREFKGVPGVKEERLNEGYKVSEYVEYMHAQEVYYV